MSGYDAIIIGRGIAGASVAYAVSRRKRVLLLERQAQAGYHATHRGPRRLAD